MFEKFDWTVVRQKWVIISMNEQSSGVKKLIVIDFLLYDSNRCNTPINHDISP